MQVAWSFLAVRDTTSYYSRTPQLLLSARIYEGPKTVSATLHEHKGHAENRGSRMTWFISHISQSTFGAPLPRSPQEVIGQPLASSDASSTGHSKIAAAWIPVGRWPRPSSAERRYRLILRTLYSVNTGKNTEYRVPTCFCIQCQPTSESISTPTTQGHEPQDPTPHGLVMAFVQRPSGQRTAGGIPRPKGTRIQVCEPGLSVASDHLATGAEPPPGADRHYHSRAACVQLRNQRTRDTVPPNWHKSMIRLRQAGSIAPTERSTAQTVQQDTYICTRSPAGCPFT